LAAVLDLVLPAMGAGRRTDRDPTPHSTRFIVETWTAINCVYMVIHNWAGISSVDESVHVYKFTVHSLIAVFRELKM